MYKSLKEDRILSFSIVLFFLIQILNGSLKMIFDFSDSWHSIISNVSGFIFIFYFIFKALPIVYKRNRNVLYVSFITIGITYLFGLLFILSRNEPLDWFLREQAIFTFAFWIPVGIATYSIRDYSHLYKVFFKNSFLFTAVLILVFVKSVFTITEEQRMFYSMSFSYFLLIPVVFHLSEYFKRRRVSMLILSVLETLMIILIGSRGALLALMVYIIFSFLFSKSSVLTKTLIALPIVLIVFFFYTNVEKINTLIRDNYGISSRTMTFFTSKDFNVLSGRDVSWHASQELIKEKPILGYGIGGDYYPMVKSTSSVLGSRFIHSPHNGFLQLMMFFGIPIGLVLGLWIFFSVIKLFKNYDFHHRELIIIAFSIFVFPAMTVDDGLFIKPGIALYVYLILKYNRKQYQVSKLKQNNNETQIN